MSLNSLSRMVFNLGHEEEMILKKLAYEEGANLSAITKFCLNETSSDGRIKNYTENEISNIRRKLSRILQGGKSQTTGLVVNEFVLLRKENKHRWKQDEKTYFLSFKGLIACLSLGISLKKNTLFQGYLKFLINFLKNKNTVKILEEYFQNEIHVFLLWNAIHGINLTKLKHSSEYYKNTIEKINSLDFYSVPPRYFKGSKQIYVKYFASKYIIEDRWNALFLNQGDFIKWENEEDDFQIGNLAPEGEHLPYLIKLITNWTNAIEYLQYSDYDLLKSQNNFYKKFLDWVGFDVDSNELGIEINRQAKKLKIKYDWDAYEKLFSS